MVMLLTSVIQAQEATVVSTEFSVGAARVVTSGEWRGPRSGPLVDVLWARQRRDGSTGSLVTAIAAGVHMPILGGTTLDCIRGREGGCIQWIPNLALFSALAGWQSANARQRVLAGPVVASGDETALGVQLRAESFASLSRRVSFMASLRATTLPTLGNAPYHLLGGAIGVRIK
jgi:hypothetical protein